MTKFHLIATILLFSIMQILCLPQQAIAASDIIYIDPTAPGGPSTAIPPTTFVATAADENNTYRCIKPDSTKYTEQIVECFNLPIRNSVLNPTDGLLLKLSEFMSTILQSVIVIAIALFGVRMIAGEQNLAPQAISLILKIGIMLFLVDNVGGYAGSFFGIFDQALTLVTPGITPWQMIDSFLGEILGFATFDSPDRTIKDGIIGLLQGSLFAKNFGAMLSIVGGFAIFSLLLFIFQTVYLYLSSILAIAFLILLIPIIGPFIIFGYTGRFLDKWLDLFIYSIITPMLMFAFMAFFLSPDPTSGSKGLFKDSADKIMLIIDPAYTGRTDYLKRCLHPNEPVIFSSNMSTEPNVYNYLEDLTKSPTIPSEAAPVQTFMNPNLQKAFDNNIINLRVTKFDCGGPEDGKMKMDLLYELIILLILAILMNSMLTRIPSIASDIARGATTGVTNLVTPLTSLINKMRR